MAAQKEEEARGRMSLPPVTNWELAKGHNYCTFLSHYKVELPLARTPTLALDLALALALALALPPYPNQGGGGIRRALPKRPDPTHDGRPRLPRLDRPGRPAPALPGDSRPIRVRAHSQRAVRTAH